MCGDDDDDVISSSSTSSSFRIINSRSSSPCIIGLSTF